MMHEDIFVDEKAEKSNDSIQTALRRPKAGMLEHEDIGERDERNGK